MVHDEHQSQLKLVAPSRRVQFELCEILQSAISNQRNGVAREQEILHAFRDYNIVTNITLSVTTTCQDFLILSYCTGKTGLGTSRGSVNVACGHNPSCVFLGDFMGYTTHDSVTNTHACSIVLQGYTTIAGYQYACTRGVGNPAAFGCSDLFCVQLLTLHHPASGTDGTLGKHGGVADDGFRWAFETLAAKETQSDNVVFYMLWLDSSQEVFLTTFCLDTDFDPTIEMHNSECLMRERAPTRCAVDEDTCTDAHHRQFMVAISGAARGWKVIGLLVMTTGLMSIAWCIVKGKICTMILSIFILWRASSC